MKRINLYAIVWLISLLLTGISLNAETINVSTAGSLESLLGDKKHVVENLTLTGSLNGSDIRCIRQMGKLTALNMKDAYIVEGGAPYYGTFYTYGNAIGEQMFYGLSKLASIVIPSSVTSIGNSAFADCISLTLAELNSSLKSVSGYCFSGCTNLSSIIIPEGITDIGGYAFEGCTSLQSVTLPTTLTNIDYSSFSRCTSLKSIILPANLKDINNEAFCASGLESIVIPEGIKSLSSATFRDCKDLKSIELPKSLLIIGSNAFSGCISLPSIRIPDNVTTISNYAFSGCTSLANVELPDGLFEIQYNAFSECTSLNTINLPTELSKIGGRVFSGCTALNNITLPPYLEKIDNATFSGCTSLTAIDIPCGIIENNAFQDCTSLTIVKLPIDLMYIKDGAFSGCSSLQEITIPSRILSIGSEAFINTGLKKVTLEEGIRSIPAGTFSGCENLEEVTFPSTMASISGFNRTGVRKVVIPEGPVKIDTDAFAGCFKLNEISLPSTIDSIQNRAFLECDSLRSITIPEGVVSIGNQAFSYCDTLETVTLPSTINHIGVAAFAFSKLKSITIPEGIDSIAAGMFQGCEKLETVQLPATVKQVNGKKSYNLRHYSYNEYSKKWNYETRQIQQFGAFSECKNLKNIQFPEKVTSIGDYAFYECSKLQSVSLPQATTVGSYAFSECEELQTVSLPQATTVESYAFSECRKLQTASLPKVETIWENAFSSCGNLSEISLPVTKTIGTYAFYYCSQLKKVHLGQITDIGDQAFQYCNRLTYLQIPATLNTIGSGAFGSSEFTSVEWNASIEIPANTFRNVRYLFIPDGITGNNANATYIIRNGIADTFTAETSSRQEEDNKWIEVYEIPKAFKAKKATYSRRFTQTSGVGEAAGWETIVLPFDAEKFIYTGYSYDSGENIPLAPFGSEALQIEGTRPFWLYEMTTEGPKAAMTIEAHKPYLICMPNNNKYPNSSNISGNVNFIGEDETNGVLISETEGKLQTAKGKDYNLVPTYQTVQQNESVYQLNIGNWYDEYKPGSVFVKNGGSIQPFYAYATPASNQAAQAPFFSISFGDGGITGLEEELLMAPDKAVKATSNNGILSIESNKSRIINLYDAAGRTIRTLELQEGTNTVTDLEDGIYFLEGQKVLINH